MNDETSIFLFFLSNKKTQSSFWEKSGARVMNSWRLWRFVSDWDEKLEFCRVMNNKFGSLSLTLKIFSTMYLVNVTDIFWEKEKRRRLKFKFSSRNCFQLHNDHLFSFTWTVSFGGLRDLERASISWPFYRQTHKIPQVN